MGLCKYGFAQADSSLHCYCWLCNGRSLNFKKMNLRVFGLLIMQKINFNAIMSLCSRAHISQAIAFGIMETRSSQVM